MNRHTGKVPIAQAEGHHAPALVYEVIPGRAAVPVGGSHPLVRREEERAADAIERYLDAVGDEALPWRDPLHAWPLAYLLRNRVYIGEVVYQVKSARPA